MPTSLISSVAASPEAPTSRPRPDRPLGPLIVQLKRPAQLPGNLEIKIDNQTRRNLGLVTLTVSVLGAQGELSFEEVKAASTAKKQVSVPSIKELTVRDVVVIDEQAKRLHPRIDIRQH
jgi:hypothetical protein